VTEEIKKNQLMDLDEKSTSIPDDIDEREKDQQKDSPELKIILQRYMAMTSTVASTNQSLMTRINMIWLFQPLHFQNSTLMRFAYQP
jgi:hypothetical protein